MPGTTKLALGVYHPPDAPSQMSHVSQAPNGWKGCKLALISRRLNRVVVPHWTHRYLDRHPEYFKRKQNPLAVERNNAHNLEDMEYFESFRKLVEWFGLAPEDMWNMDETGFRIGFGKAH